MHRYFNLPGVRSQGRAALHSSKRETVEVRAFTAREARRVSHARSPRLVASDAAIRRPARETQAGGVDRLMKTPRQAFKENFWIGAKGGLLDQKHVKAMGDSVWLFLYLLRGQTGRNEFGEGVFEYGRTLTLSDISSDFGGTSERTLARWVKRLRKAAYIQTEIHARKGITFWIAKAKDKTKQPRVTTKVRTKSARSADKVSTFVHANPYANRVPIQNESLREPCTDSSESIREPRADFSTERLQVVESANTCGVFENSIPKDSIPKSLFYNNTHAASPFPPSLLEETAKKLQPQENPFCLEERQKQLQEQSKAILAKYPDSGKKPVPTWKEIRAVGYGPVERNGAA